MSTYLKRLTKSWPLRRLLVAAYVCLLGAALVGVAFGIRLLVGRFLDETRRYDAREVCQEAWERLGLPGARFWARGGQDGVVVLREPSLAQLELLIRDLARPERPIRWRDEGEGVMIQAGGRPGPLYSTRYSSKFQWWRLSISTSRGEVGSLEIGLDRHPDRKLLKALGRYLILCSLAMLSLAIIVCSWLATYWLAPLKSLSETLEKLAEGDLSARPPKMRGWLIPAEWDRLGQCAAEMAARLEASFTSQRRFISDSSHELRTPLTAIAAMAELLDSEELSQKDRERASATIARESRRMTRLVEDLLALSRADEGRPLPEQDCDLSATSLSLREEFKQVDPSRTIRIESVGRPCLKAPNTLIRTIIRNLLENALRYSDDEIVCRVQELSDRVELQVEDKGCGIPETELSKVFERFYRSDCSRSRATGGSGLGLAIVKSLVERTNGVIEIESKLGVGTKARVFWVRKIVDEHNHSGS